MAITDKKTGVWGLDQVYNKANQGSIWTYSGLAQLWTWGGANWGQVGVDNSTQYSSPVQIPGSWDKLSHTKEYNLIGIKSDGTLWIQGLNNVGQLGQNNNTWIKSPVQIPGSWSDVDGGYRKTLAVKTDGTLWAWGYGYQGGLAHGGSPGHTDRSSPTQVTGGGTTWTSPKTGGASGGSSAALKTDGTLWTWGNNTDGALGLNDTTHYSSPKQIPGTTWSSINISDTGPLMLATKTDGTLWVWGNNSDGQLGQNSRTQYSSPKQIPGTTWATGNKQTTSGNNTAFAIKTDGTLWAMGDNTRGALGQNNRTGYSSPVQIPGTTWSKVDNASNNTLALKTDGTLWAWGDNRIGELSQNNVTEYSSPVQIPGTGWDDISSSAYGQGAIKKL
tara:strand:- start:7 stop:1170 length:1164 start_codon:yes stop_codon:yes gene_type:complete